LALYPLAAVEPHLPRPRSVGADLDEPRPEIWVQDVEVVDPDPPFLPEVLKARGLGVSRSVTGGEHPLELLTGDDRDHAEAALTHGLLSSSETIRCINAALAARECGTLAQDNEARQQLREPPTTAADFSRAEQALPTCRNSTLRQLEVEAASSLGVQC